MCQPNQNHQQNVSKFDKICQKNTILKYIYFEENASSKVASTLADEAGVKTAVLNPIESLTSKQIKAGEDYFSVMEENLKALQLTTDVAGKTIKAETDTTKTVQNGYFKDKDVTDRSLSDWLVNGNQFTHIFLTAHWIKFGNTKLKLQKVKKQPKNIRNTTQQVTRQTLNKSISAVKRIPLHLLKNGEKYKFTYKYVGYKILTYEKVTVVSVICLKRMMKMLVNSNTSNLVTTISQQQMPSISTFSGVAKARRTS